MVGIWLCEVQVLSSRTYDIGAHEARIGSSVSMSGLQRDAV